MSEVVLEALPSIQPPSQNSHIDNEEEEVSTAISQMKNGKTPRLDGISSEVLKLGGEASVCWLSSIFTNIWMEETVSSHWQKQLLVPKVQFTGGGGGGGGGGASPPNLPKCNLKAFIDLGTWICHRASY